MLYPTLRRLLLLLAIGLSLFAFSVPAQAGVDAYVARYLKVSDPVMLPAAPDGQLRSFSAEELSEGKRFFERNCLNCHVGGATLPNPIVSLSLTDLKGATPPHDTISGLVEYFRYPTVYDGSEESLWCRTVSESWLPQAKAENLAAFILRAAEVAPGWGTETFQDDSRQR